MNDIPTERVLTIRELSLGFGASPAIDSLSLEINRGEMVALVGESGCGKTLTALSCIGLVPPAATIRGGFISMGCGNMISFGEDEWNDYRGKQISMIFQEPMTALNPLLKVGYQIAENAVCHGSSKKEANVQALSMMRKVDLPDAEQLFDCYPHQLSGGMRQRIMICMALINRPSLLIADEPTTALDVTIQAQIMDLLTELNRTTGTAVLLISHDLGVVRHLCRRIYVMYAGKIVESGPTADILREPLHPYTQGLLASIPSIRKRNQRLSTIPGAVIPVDKRNTNGCLFRDRCPRQWEICRTRTPESGYLDGTRAVACHLYTAGTH